MALSLNDFSSLIRNTTVLPSGGDTTVRLEGDQLTTGKWQSLGTRSAAFKADNQRLRQQFLDAVAGRFNGLASIPDSVKAQLKINDFKLDGEGRVCSERPLTMRRIQAVMNAVADFEICHQKLDVDAIKATKGEGVVIQGEPGLERCVAMYNELSDRSFEIGNLFEQSSSSEGDPVRSNRNGQLIADFTKDTDKHFNAQATKVAKSYVQAEVASQLSFFAKGEKTQFAKDVDRGNFINDRGELLPSDEKAATDRMARDLHPGVEGFAQLSSREQTKIHLVQSLITQDNDMTISASLSAPLDAARGNRTPMAMMLSGGNTKAQTTLYSYSFDKDGGISVSLCRYKDAGVAMMEYLNQDPEAASPMLEGRIQCLTRMDVHISAAEVDRIGDLVEQGRFAQIDGGNMAHAVSKIRIAEKDRTVEIAKLLPKDLRVDMDIRVSGKLLVND